MKNADNAKVTNLVEITKVLLVEYCHSHSQPNMLQKYIAIRIIHNYILYHSKMEHDNDLCLRLLCIIKLKADVPQLEAIVAKSWGTGEELKQLKSDLAALDRKITAALAPKKEEQDGEENKQQSETQRVEVRDNHSQSNDSKESMVAEPPNYNPRETSGSHIIIGGCGINPPGSFRAAGPKL